MPITQDQEASLLTAYKLGLNDGQIGRKCGVRTKSVCNWRAKHGHPANQLRGLSPDETEARRADYRRGLNDNQLAALWGIHPYSVLLWRQRQKLPTNCPETRHLSNEERAARMLLYSFGYSDARIAKEQSRCSSTISKWRKVLSLSPNRRRDQSLHIGGRRKAESALMDRIRRSLPPYMSPADRDDAASDLFLAVMSGAIPIAEIEGRAKKFGNKVIEQFASKFGPRSLDEELGDEDGFRMIDLIRDDRSSSWLEEMGATVW